MGLIIQPRATDHPSKKACDMCGELLPLDLLRRRFYAGRLVKQVCVFCSERR